MQKENHQNNMKILFYCGGGDRDKLMLSISKELNKQGMKHEAYYIAQFRSNKIYLEEQGVDSSRIFPIHFLKRIKEYPDKEWIADKEREYGLETWHYWNTTADRKNSRKKLRKIRVYQILEYTLRKAENCLDKVKPDCLICYGTDCYDKLIINQMAMSKGTKLMEIVHARIRDKFVVVDNLVDDWKLNITNRTSPETEAFITNFREKPDKAQSEDKMQSSLSYKLSRLYKWVKMNFHERRIPHDIKGLFTKIKAYFDLRHFESVKEEKYIFFPLHYQPEAAVLIYGKWYNNQVAFIENLAKCIPFGYTLYVKEHQNTFGNRRFGYYKEIKRIPNVKLLSPYLDVFSLTKNSSLVVTISGTVGFEALIFGKPVITVGDVYYSACSEVAKCGCWADMPPLIREKLSKEVDMVNVKRFITGLLNKVYDGFVGVPSENNGLCLEENNIKKIAKGIIRHAKRQE